MDGNSSLRVRVAGLRGCLQIIRVFRDLRAGQTVILERIDRGGTEANVRGIPERRMPDGSMMWLGLDGWRPAVPGMHVSSPRGLITRVGLGTFTYQTADGAIQKVSVWKLVRTYLWGPLEPLVL